MYKYTNIVNNKKIDIFVILICSDFEKNIRGLEKKFKIKFPKKMAQYFKDKKSKYLKQMVGDKLFIISKVSDGKCSKDDLDSSIKDICSDIIGEKDEGKKLRVQIILSPIKSFIRYQVIRTVYYLYDYKEKQNLEIIFCGIKNLKKLILNSVLEGEIINKMRTMVNQPANIMTTDAFLKNVKNFKKKNLSIEIFDKKKLKKDKFNLILAVNKGSNQNPYLLTVKWMPNKKEKPIVLVGKGATLKNDAAVNYRILKKLKYSIKEVSRLQGVDLRSMSAAHLVIDAIFGVGLNRPIGDPFYSIIEAVNQKAKKVLAVDIPSGLDGTTGKVYGTCVKADKTVTFSFAKKGFFKAQGPKHVGHVVVVDIGIPKKLLMVSSK